VRAGEGRIYQSKWTKQVANFLRRNAGVADLDVQGPPLACLVSFGANGDRAVARKLRRVIEQMMQTFGDPDRVAPDRLITLNVDGHQVGAGLDGRSFNIDSLLHQGCEIAFDNFDRGLIKNGFAREEFFRRASAHL
jgi:hypothetical protein